MEYFKDLAHINTIHFIGIGGVSMSALAKLCLSYGKNVSGSDKCENDLTEELKHLGAKIFVGHKKSNVKNPDLIIYTSAIKNDNVEILEANKKHILVLERNDFLNLIANEYNNVIAVSGTHGKTTTTSMIASIFIYAKKNPTVHLGGYSENINGNLKIGSKEFFITEACEYQKHLLKIKHDVGVVLNIEEDHLDCYKDINEICDTFHKFCLMSKKISVINENFINIINCNKLKIKTFGNNVKSNYYAKNIRQYKNGIIKFDCIKNGNFFGKFEINCYGKHNVLNALSAIIVADYYNIKVDDIINGLKSYRGVKRRFEFIGEINDCIVIEDYAHHPSEIKATINTAYEVFKKPITVVFQPHTYSRTKKLLKEFLTSFENANKIYILPTFSAREKFMKNSSGKFLAKKLKFNYDNVEYFTNFNSVYKKLIDKKNSVILLLGAGDIHILAERIKKDYIKFLNK